MDIYQYDDFRLFLKERYHQKMLDVPKYSYRKFAQEAGFANPGYLNDVVKGFKPLSENAVEKMGKAFQLKAHEIEFLKKLVRDLCEWNLVEQGPDGRYQTTSSVVEPGTLMPGMGRQLNGEWLAQAREALHRLPKEKRHVSTMVLNISEALSREINEMVEKF